MRQAIIVGKGHTAIDICINLWFCAGSYRWWKERGGGYARCKCHSGSEGWEVFFCLYLLVEIEKGEEGLPVRVDVLGRIGLRGNVGLVNGVGMICSKLLRGVGRAFCTPNL